MIDKEKVVNYVKQRNNTRKEYRVGSISVIVKDPVNIDISQVITEINMIIPDHLLELIDVIYVGEFSFFQETFNARYMDGAIYVSNQQDDEQDLKDDIVHEIAHAIEDNFNFFIYGDGKIKNEYIGKLKRLKSILSFEGYSVDDYNFFNLEYEKSFDDFLHKEIGYERLFNLTSGLFLAPYSVTSIREYFARAFEEFYLGDRIYLRNICPYINEKLLSLEREEIYET